ncbi:unnamed protein product [Phytomonas sp. Hart1]|nr:unnamed protein product [Phytomonas sp. Hart1]|eukprot:CCW72086.1 unnamed protein product [Phytomonas sp. isolate Hart1]
MRWAVDIAGIDIEADLRHEANKRIPQEPTGLQKARWLALDDQKLGNGEHTEILGSVWVPNQAELQKLYDARISNPKLLETPFGLRQQQFFQGSMPKRRNEGSSSINSNNMPLSQGASTQSLDKSFESFKCKEICIFSTFLNPQGKRTAVTIVMNQPVFKGVDVVNAFLKNYVNADERLSQRFSTNPRLYKLFFADEFTGEEDMAVQLDLIAQNFSCYFVNPLPAARLYLFPQRTGLLPSTPYDIHLTVQIRPLDHQGKPIQRKCLVPADMLAENLETTVSSRLLSSAIVQGSLRIKYGPLELNINEYCDFGPGCGRPSCPIAERTILSLYRFGVTEVVVSGRAVEDVAGEGPVKDSDAIAIEMDLNEAFSFQQFEVIRINRYGARQQWLLCVDGEHLYTVKPNSDSIKTVERPIKDIEEVRVFSSRPRYMEVVYTRASRLEEDHFECSTASNCAFLNEKLRIIRHELHKKQEKEIQAAAAKERHSLIHRLLDGFKSRWFIF